MLETDNRRLPKHPKPLQPDKRHVSGHQVITEKTVIPWRVGAQELGYEMSLPQIRLPSTKIVQSMWSTWGS